VVEVIERRPRPLLDGRKVRAVATFELAEALRSRLVLVVLAIYGAGAAIGAYIFSRTLEAAESAVRDSLLGSWSSVVPDDVVRKQALPRVISFLVHDEALRNELLGIEPLAIFYGFMALEFVAPLVLVTSGGAHASDITSGAVRFVLPRCDRLSWSLGKFLGHATLLGIGLLVGALATGAVAELHRGIDAASVLWLLRAAFRAWVYGLAYLGIFCGVSLIARQPSRARAFSVVLLFLLWAGHLACQAPLVLAQLPALQYLVWAFPAQYQQLLWSPSWLYALPAQLALLGIAGATFALGYLGFRRADA
jgi:ABC-type transport system involved in multi-copper enzyme maturation permease subunit